MKIAVIGYSKEPYYRVQVVGGMQLVERNQLRLLSQFGHQVHHITNSDSELADGVIQYKTVPSKFGGQDTLGVKRTRTRNEMVRALLENIQPDVVISHDDPNNGLLKVLIEVGIPSITFIHSDVAQSGGPGIINYMKEINEYAHSGHIPVCVSTFSANNWAEQFKKSGKWLGNANGKWVFRYHCWPAILWEQPPLYPTVNEFVQVGRPDKFKNLHWAQDAVKNLRTFTTKPKNEAEGVIWAKLHGDVQTGAPRQELLSYVAQSKALIFSGMESFGLGCVEANSYGVPVIIVTKKDRHSGIEACAGNAENYILCNPKELKELTDNWDSTKFNREAIQSNTWEAFNPNAAHNRLMAIINDAMKQRKSFTSFFS